jgi:hypothetical protein
LTPLLYHVFVIPKTWQQKVLAGLLAFRVESFWEESMKLSQDAEIAREKLTRYLLVKRPVGDKSEFLKRARRGFP